MTERAQPCVGWDEDLSALIDEELEPARRTEVEAHLASCARCSERMLALRAVDARLAAIPLPVISDRIAPPRPGAGSAPPQRRVSLPAPRPRSTPPRDTAPRRAAWKTGPLMRIAGAAVIALSLYWLITPEREPIAERGEAPAFARVPAGSLERAAPPQHPGVVPDPPEPVAIAASEAAQATDTEIASSLDEASDEELALVFDLETIENLDLIANLELLERLVAIEEGRG